MKLVVSDEGFLAETVGLVESARKFGNFKVRLSYIDYDAYLERGDPALSREHKRQWMEDVLPALEVVRQAADSCVINARRFTGESYFGDGQRILDASKATRHRLILDISSEEIITRNINFWWNADNAKPPASKRDLYFICDIGALDWGNLFSLCRNPCVCVNCKSHLHSRTGLKTIEKNYLSATDKVAILYTRQGLDLRTHPDNFAKLVEQAQLSCFYDNAFGDKWHAPERRAEIVAEAMRRVQRS